MSFKIHFMGTPEFAVPVLKSINNSTHEVLTVYTQSPKKKARGQKIIESPIHQCANKLNIPVRFPKDINSDEEYNFIKNVTLFYCDGNSQLLFQSMFWKIPQAGDTESLGVFI